MLLLRTSRGVDPGIPLLRSLGSNAHVWLPGASGVSVASLPSNNYLLSDGSTGYSTVDGVDGLTLDGMGALGSELVGTYDFTTYGTAGGVSARTTNTFTTTSVGGVLTVNGLISLGVTYTITVTGTTTATQIYLRNPGTLTNSTAASTGAFTLTLTCAWTDVANIYLQNTTAGFTTITSFSCKPYTGTHLTQATTANKPLVRRGMYNYALQSNAFGNASWQKSRCDVVEGNAVAPDGTLTADTLTCNVSNSSGAYAATNAAIALPAGTATATLAFVVKAGSQSWCALQHYDAVANGVTQWFNLSTGAVGSAVTFGTGWSKASASMAAVGNGYYLVAFSANVTGTTDKIYIYQAVPSDTTYPCTLGDVTYIHSGAMFTGTWTAAQILAEGGIPTTTATAASNPSAGKYWWSFDGSNDSLLSGNLGITNACTIVIAGRVNTLPANTVLFGEDANGVQISIASNGEVSFTKKAVVILVTTAAGMIVAGVPFVLTCRLSAGTAVIRKLGTQVATAATAQVFAATTGARIGTAFDGVSFPVNGAIGWVVPLPTALSDADCLTVERLVSSQFPNGPVF